MAVRFLTFIHRSPYATWNPLQAWIRRNQEVPEVVVLMHLAANQEHAEVVARGVRKILRHYGGPEVPVRHLAVEKNAYQTWLEKIRGLLDAERGRWVIDVTPARTVPKLAAMASIRPPAPHEVLYLDVSGHRYEPKPFPWIPYNLQTLRFLKGEQEEPAHRQVQPLRAPPGLPPMARLAPRRVGIGHREVSIPWEGLVVLLNEAGAAGNGQFPIKLPSFGVTIGEYSLDDRRFRLEPWERIQRDIHAARAALDGLWQNEVPSDDFVLEALASARLLPFADQVAYQAHLHEVAADTRGPNPGVPLKALALDTNLFYLEFFTALTHAAGVPMTRVPLVASQISLHEIRHKMGYRFPDGDLPRPLREADIHHPHEARKAHTAHEEFEMLRTRCRMTVVHHHEGQAGGPDANDRNDEAILMDFLTHQESERQELLVLSNDRGFVKRAQRSFGALQVAQVDYADPAHDVSPEADIDQIAYLVYRLALGYGSVSLTGLDVQVFGDHPRGDHEAFLHETVRVRVPERPWCRAFLHELGIRDGLRKVVAEGGIWL